MVPTKVDEREVGSWLRPGAWGGKERNEGLDLAREVFFELFEAIEFTVALPVFHVVDARSIEGLARSESAGFMFGEPLLKPGFQAIVAA